MGILIEPNDSKDICGLTRDWPVLRGHSAEYLWTNAMR